MKLDCVTITGADDSVKQEELRELHQQFSFVEFGILVHAGPPRTRFPSSDWIRRLVKILPIEARIAVHVCGPWVNEILMGSFPHDGLRDLFGNGFNSRVGRYQINTHGIERRFNWRLIERFDVSRLIFQYDEANTKLIETAVKCHGRDKISVLFDCSHGAGVMPQNWPNPLSGVYCGYSGGLSPDNLPNQLHRIESKVHLAHTWVDAETRLRSRDGAIFDVSKATVFLWEAAQWMQRKAKSVKTRYPRKADDHLPPAGENEEC